MRMHTAVEGTVGIDDAIIEAGRMNRDSLFLCNTLIMVNNGHREKSLVLAGR